jgi:hypothetical protein
VGWDQVDLPLVASFMALHCRNPVHEFVFRAEGRNPLPEPRSQGSVTDPETHPLPTSDRSAQSLGTVRLPPRIATWQGSDTPAAHKTE